MRDTTWWIAMSLTLTNAMTFLIAMPTLFRGRRGNAPLRIMLVASIAMGVTAVIAALASRSRIPATSMAFGGVLAIGAQLVFWFAVRAYRGYRPSGAFATDAPPFFVSTGPYRWVRHPFYVSYVMAFMAGAVFAGQLWVWVIPVAMFAQYALAARREEELIVSSTLAASYMAYRRTTGFFLPRL